MIEFQIRGNTYRTLTIPPMPAFHLAARLGPILPSIGNVIPVAGMLMEIKQSGVELARISAEDMEAITAAAEPTLKAFAAMSDADREYVLFNALAASERKMPDGNWARVMDQTGKHVVHMDIKMPDMLAIAFNVIKDNFSDFFPGLGPTSAASGAPGPATPP